MKTGHLHLSERVKIAEKIENPNIINKIYLECTKLIYRKYNITDQVITNLLCDAEQFLYFGKSCDFKKLYDLHKNSLEEISEQPLSRVAATVLSLLGSLACDAEGILNIEDYEGEDDVDFDYDMWNPDFYASNAFVGGFPDEKTELERMGFWNCFLDIKTKIIENPNKLQTLQVKK